MSRDTDLVLQATPFASDSLGNTIPPGDIKDPMNARADFLNASEERNLRNISRHSRVLFERIHGTQGILRVASSYRLKQLKNHIDAAHFRMHTISSVLSTVKKRRLRVQNISAGCILSCTNTSTQQEVLSFCLRKQGISVSSTSLQSEHCPSGIYLPKTLSGSLPPSSRDIGNSLSRRLVDTSPRLPSVTSPPVSVTKHTE